MEIKPWHDKNPFDCPLLHAMNVLGGKWKPILVYMLSLGMHRFGEIKKKIPQVSQKVLTQQLRELETDGIVFRKVYAEVPPRVEYNLTELGIRLTPLVMDLYAWGEDYRNNVKFIEFNDQDILISEESPPVEKRA